MKSSFLRCIMLNRRILRIKVLKELYAFESYCDANFDMALDYIADKFAPDFSSIESVDKTLLSKEKALSQRLFREHYKTDNIESFKNSDGKVEKVVWEAYDFLIEQNKSDYQRIKKNLLTGIEKLYDSYLKILKLLVLLARQVEKDTKEPFHVQVDEGHQIKIKNLPSNRVIQIIEKNIEFQEQVMRRNISWDNESDIIYSWYKELVKKDKEYIAYREYEKTEFESDRKILMHLIKNVFFKSDLFNSYMESVDLHWSEDKGVLKSMVSRTLKSIEPDKPKLELAILSKNWEDDKVFFNDLLKFSIESDKDFDHIISGKSKNWDISRIAKVDKIILKMAMAEFINFPSIPVKVTINEYIELSKNYSTPKSKKFVNGLLDVISSELKEKGIIKKSGRGLIDNK